MKYIFPLLFLWSCSKQSDIELMTRALNDEAMQQINLSFENGNDGLYHEVEKNRAALKATKGNLPDYKNYEQLQVKFSLCKTYLNAQQDIIATTYQLPIYSPDIIYPTSSLSQLDKQINFDLKVICDTLAECIYGVKRINASDSICRMISVYNLAEYNPARNYSYQYYAQDIDSLLSDFQSFYSTQEGIFSLIDVFEFFTLCRTTLLIAERKTMRFHCETLLTSPKVEIGNEIDVAITPNKMSYAPGEKMILTPGVFDPHKVSYTHIRYKLDTNKTVCLGLDPGINTRFIPLDTRELGEHHLEVEYISFLGRADTLRKSFNYVVLKR